MRILLVAVLLAAAGCGTPAPRWIHPAKDPSEFKDDERECERFFGGSDSDMRGCLVRKGWKRR